LGLNNYQLAEKLKLTEPNGLLTTNYSRLGKKIDQCYPLLDPSLTFD